MSKISDKKRIDELRDLLDRGFAVDTIAQRQRDAAHAIEIRVTIRRFA